MIRAAGRAVLAGLAAVLLVGASDPLTARLEVDDAQRFAALFAETQGQPSAAQLQKQYIDPGSEGVRVFTPGRIEDAQNLAKAIAENREAYAYAIKTCLPLADSLTGDMRAIYLAYRGLVPERPLPRVFLVFGAGNSGGTASNEAQVMGLEVVCGPGTTPEQFRTTMRSMFAHETVHSWQGTPSREVMRDLLLASALREGVPDYLARLVTGQVPGAERNAWAAQREAWLWQEFNRDRQRIPDPDAPSAEPVFRRWFANYGHAPEGWPSEAGYWVGMRIAESYVAQAADKRAAIADLIAMKDPKAILAASRYAPAR